VAPDGFIIGTLAYMAPEQFEGHSSDVLTDVFGFGAVYYEFVTGQRAFDPEAPERCQNSRSYEPPAVRMLVENCPAWLDHQIGRLLAKRRDTRLASLGEMLIDTRPALQKLKKERANELASGIAPLINAGDPEAANLLIEQVFRLDETNQEARTQRGRLQSAQREQARALARELVQRGEAEFADGEVEKAYRTFAEALELDIGNATIEKLVDKAQNKLEDCRTAQRLVNEVNDDLAAAGSAGMPGWQVERVFGLITRATRLDEYNREAARLRSQLHAVYQEVCDWRIGSRSATDETIPGGEWSEWYERCLIDARKARKNRDFDYAQEILSKLLASASDDRVQRELNAVAEDREAHHAAETARFWAADWKRRGNPEAALHVLDEFAERYPRRAKAVEDDRRMLEKELNPVTSHENSE
jgi:serine/threonine protein kinase